MKSVALLNMVEVVSVSSSSTSLQFRLQILDTFVTPCKLCGSETVTVMSLFSGVRMHGIQSSLHPQQAMLPWTSPLCSWTVFFLLRRVIGNGKLGSNWEDLAQHLSGHPNCGKSLSETKVYFFTKHICLCLTPLQLQLD